MIHQELLKTNREPFVAYVRQIAQVLGIQPEWMMQLMYQESGLDHTISNTYTGATGLIQFMPDTAKNLGTTTTELKTMSNIRQLDYVYLYLKSFKGRMNSFTDLYFAVFFPLAMNRPDDWVLETQSLSRSKIAQQNAIYDLNKDGKITVGEVKTAIMKKVPAGWKEFFVKKKLR